jgi:uncharacterized protein (TIGR03083 family)
MPLDFLAHIRRESARFGEVLRACDPDAPVPSCPDWTAADLLWHLVGVQHFWGTIVRDRLDAPPDLEPERPADYADLLAEFDSTAESLAAALAELSDDVAVWTWSDDHTVGFIRRRQAHEALIHRLDAELTAGAVTDFDRALAADGVDEALRVMFGGRPSWATWRPDGPTGRVRAGDGDGEWLFRSGYLSGTSPQSGTVYTDEPGIELLDDGATPSFTMTASARDLDAYLWNRPVLEEVQVAGSDADYQRFAAMVGAGIQ